MKQHILKSAAAAFVLTLAATPADATVYMFELTGNKTADFSIDSAATPSISSTSVFGDQIGFDNVTGIFGGTSQTASISFGTSLFAQLNIVGTTLSFTQYAFANGEPVFNLGSFNLSSITSGPATITISAASGAVPEPGTWAMMLVGFGAVGFAMRSSRRKRLSISYT